MTGTSFPVNIHVDDQVDMGGTFIIARLDKLSEKGTLCVSQSLTEASVAFLTSVSAKMVRSWKVRIGSLSKSNGCHSFKYGVSVISFNEVPFITKTKKGSKAKK